MTTLNKLGARRPTWAEINLCVLRNNFLSLRRFLPNTVRIIPVLKADAYGHGAVKVAKCLETLKVEALAVAIAEEAIALREAGVQEKLLLLNGFWPGQEPDIVHHQLTPAVYHADSICRLATAALAQQRQTSCHLKIDTGMARLGIDIGEAIGLLEAAKANRWINCEGIYTHLSSAENVDCPSSHTQIRLFSEFLEFAEKQGHSFSWRHVANSAGILNFKESWFDSVRSGLLLYGVNPLPLPLSELKIHPVLSLKSRILQLRNVRSGRAIGYGGDFTVKRKSVIATLPIGYADGLMRQLSNRGEVLVRGHRAPIVGRISMDLALIDVTDIENPAVDDEVVLIGCQGGEQIRVEEVAASAGTISYEILCRIGSRVPRMYLENSESTPLI